MNSHKKLLSLIIIFSLLLTFVSYSVYAADSTTSFIDQASKINKDVVKTNLGQNPSAIKFLMVIVLGIKELVSGNIAGFIGYAFAGLPLIGVFFLLYIVSKYLAVITIFRKEEFRGYANIFGWGMAFIGVATNSVFQLIYGLMGSSVSIIIFFILAIFMIVIAWKHMAIQHAEVSAVKYGKDADAFKSEQDKLKAKHDFKQDKALLKNETKINKIQLTMDKKAINELLNILKTIQDFGNKIRDKTTIENSFKSGMLGMGMFSTDVFKDKLSNLSKNLNKQFNLHKNYILEAAHLNKKEEEDDAALTATPSARFKQLMTEKVTVSKNIDVLMRDQSLLNEQISKELIKLDDLNNKIKTSPDIDANIAELRTVISDVYKYFYKSGQLYQQYTQILQKDKVELSMMQKELY